MPQASEALSPQNAKFERLKTRLRDLANNGPDVDQQTSRARSAEYWRELNPDLPLLDGREFSWDPSALVEASQLEKAIEKYHSAGFLSLPNVLNPDQAQRMRMCIETLRRNDWPPVFAFVYDAFWTSGRSRSLGDLLGTLLGGEYRLLPRLWAHYVYPAKGNSGWRPHIDGNENSPLTVSVWIPLSEATLGNGCMHVVKRDEITDRLSRNYRQIETFTAQEVHALLRNTRALPASPGQVLCWDQTLIHWGGAVDESSEPRVSLALEFSTPSFPLTDADPLIIDPSAPLPSLEIRLEFIARAILLYRKFELFNERFVQLAERLVPQKLAAQKIAAKKPAAADSTPVQAL